MNIQLINPKPDDVIVLNVGPRDKVSDAEQTYHTLLDTFPNNKIIITFLENDIEVKNN